MRSNCPECGSDSLGYYSHSGGFGSLQISGTQCLECRWKEEKEVEPDTIPRDPAKFQELLLIVKRLVASGKFALGGTQWIGSMSSCPNLHDPATKITVMSISPQYKGSVLEVCGFGEVGIDRDEYEEVSTAIHSDNLARAIIENAIGK